MASHKSKALKALSPRTPLNFLLGCSEGALGNFELSRLASVADLRSELHAILDKLIDEMAQAAVAGWFRTVDRDTLRQALENPDDPIEWAKEQIRIGQRGEGGLVPLTSLPPGAAHLAAALRYQERNIAAGKCAICPQPLARHSVRYCDRHLALARGRYKPKGGKGGPPGSLEYLYGGVFESGHGRQPGTLAVLAQTRERQQRSTEREKLLYSRVAEQLGMSAAYVHEVALARRRSKDVSAALEAEAERMAPGTAALEKRAKEKSRDA